MLTGSGSYVDRKWALSRQEVPVCRQEVAILRQAVVLCVYVVIYIYILKAFMAIDARLLILDDYI